MMKLKFMKAEELDQKFDQNVAILEHFDLSTARRPGLEIKRVNVDFPISMVDALSLDAFTLHVSDRQDACSTRS